MFEHFDHHPHHPSRRVELANTLAFRTCEAAKEVTDIAELRLPARPTGTERLTAG
jgi:hypothetical protein